MKPSVAARRIIGESTDGDVVTYFRKGDEVLVNYAGDEFMAKPEEQPGAELVFHWADPSASAMIGGAFVRSLGVQPVQVTIGELRAMGGIFAQAADFYLRTQ